MRVAGPGMLLTLAAGAAAAAEVPIGGPYGNAAGCALYAEAAVIPPGIGLIVMPGYIATEQTLCEFLEATPDGAGWRIQARCVQNQTIRYGSEFTLTEEPDRGAIVVAAVSPSAPDGRYFACQGRPARAGAPL